MKTHRFVWVCLFCWLSFQAHSQEVALPKTRQWLISPSLMIPLNQWGALGEVTYLNTTRFRYFASIGLTYQDNNIGGAFQRWLLQQRFGNSIQITYLFRAWLLPISLGAGYALGRKRKHLIEGAMLYRYANIQDDRDFLFRAQAHQVNFYLGYRFQPPKGGIFIRGGINLDLFVHGNYQDNQVQPPTQGIVFYNAFKEFERALRFGNPFAPEITVGWSFRVKKKKVEDIE